MKRSHFVRSLAFLVLAGTTFAQGISYSVRDTAGLFGADAIARATAQLNKIGTRDTIPLKIETIESLKGETIDDAALQRARRSASKGIYILIAAKEHKINVLVSRTFRDRIPEADALAIRDAMIDDFKQGDFDAGLERGVEMLGAALARSAPASNTPETEGAEKDAHDGGSLVLRNQVRLTLAGARRILAGAEKKATAMGLKMNIAVVDDGGHMLAFERMDGARPASGYTATTKAITAATFRAPSGPVPAGTTSPDPLLNLSLQNAAMASGGKLTTLYGGVPVVVDGQVIGGVGVGGGSGEQDATVARAGIDELLTELKSSQEDHKK